MSNISALIVRFALLVYLSFVLLRLQAQNPYLSTSNLPIMVIETNGQTIVDEPKINARMRLVSNGPNERNSISGPFNAYDGGIGIELRGSSSQDIYPKKGYALETRDIQGEDSSVVLLGMPKESDWVLIGPYNDKSLIRDVLAYNLARQIMDYAPRTAFIELLINNEYMGVYVLAERIKRDKNRVDIAKAGTEITGGYILKMDKYTGASNEGWISKYPPTAATFQKTDILYEYPKPDDLDNLQRAYIKNWIDNFENRLAAPNFQDPINGYLPLIKLQTFLDYMLINEAVKNIDAYRLSTFFYKDADSKDGRLQMGSVWDFNIAFGIGDYCNGASTTGWAWNHHQYCPDDYWLVPFWWEKFRSDSNYLQALSQRWTSLRAGALSNNRVFSTIDSLQNLVAEAQVRNFQRWPVLGTYVWPNAYVGPSHASEVNYLRTWLTQRLAWMDGQIPQLTVNVPVPPENPVLTPRVFPNPVKGNDLFLEIFMKKGAQITLKLVDVQGKVLSYDAQTAIEEGNQVLKWPIPKVAGVYFYQIEVGGKTHTGSVVFLP